MQKKKIKKLTLIYNCKVNRFETLNSAVYLQKRYISPIFVTYLGNASFIRSGLYPNFFLNTMYNELSSSILPELCCDLKII